MLAVIMAGGKGTRVACVNSSLPKPMLPLLGKPILERQIEVLKRQGIDTILLVVGHLGEKIQEYFGDGEKFGVRIFYLVEKTPLGTAGALYYLKDYVREDFLLLCGDLVFDVDISKFYAFHKSCGGICTILTHPNSHPYDSALIVCDKEHRVIHWLHKEEPRGYQKNCVNAGLHFFSPKIFERFCVLQKLDLDRDVLKPLILEGALYAYPSSEYVKDMGTPERLLCVEKDLKSGKVQQMSLLNKQRAIFLDRDGTINEYVGFLKNIEDFRLLEGAAEAIRLINESGYLAIVITNQPVVARGEVTFEELDRIHAKMESLLGERGAFLNAVYFCPHHPDGGFEGERADLKFDCDCRKPKIGLLLRAQKDFNIDFSASWFVGDGKCDILCGKNAGCKTAKIGEPENTGADIVGENLLDCIQKIGSMA